MRVLMVGATGATGSLVLAQMVRRGVTVRALVRNEQRAELARANGAHETVIGDLEYEPSLREGAVGMEGVFHLGPAFAARETEMGLSMVRAARDAGVRKFVFSSVIHPTISLTNHQAKLPVEGALCESGMDFTILQPARFMQNLTMTFRDAPGNGKMAVPYSVTSKMCWVDYRDVAEVAARAMTGDELAYGTFELCAPGLFDSIETAEMINAVVNRRVVAEQVAPEVYASRIYDGPMRQGMLRMLAHYDDYGLAGGNDLVLRAILGREPRTLAGFIRESLVQLT
jgi:uncharacterized protein YbjT (DUF2867 family)